MSKGTLHYAHPTGLALGLTTGIVYIICAVLSAIWPDSLLWLVGHWIHTIDLSKIATPSELNLGRFILGLVSSVISAYVVGVLFGWLYNRCLFHCLKWGWIKNP